MTGSILTINGGSCSLKFALFDNTAELTATVRGEIEDLDAAPHLLARDASGAVPAERRWPAGSAAHPFATALDTLLNFTDAHLGRDGLAAVGHRVVHGGADHVAPEMITPALPALLETLTPLDPLHMPDNLAPMRAVIAARPQFAQVACFDTAFHHTMPPVAVRFALPHALVAKGVRRYGFHGLSYEYISSCLKKHSPTLARGRVIAAHLGSGASLCALNDGSSVTTTTGFSALDGLVMATRCGSLDPGVILYLRRQGYSFTDVEDMLYRRSGLFGVSGISGDVRVLLASDDQSSKCSTGIGIMKPSGVTSLQGKRGLVVGIGNEASIAAGCARASVAEGAELAATYLNDRARPHVSVVTDPLGCKLLLPCDVRVPGQLEAAFERIRTELGQLDFLLHAIAFASADDLHGRVVDCSAEGFAMAMDVSCHSFLSMARLAEPSMKAGGCLLTVTFCGSERVVAHDNLMGPVKAALESAVRHTAAELGPKGIRAHAISPGPIRNRAASGIDRFDELLDAAAATAPEHHLVDIDDVGALAAFLVSDGARHITGTIIPVDGGQHLIS
jgi:acetate kinase